MKIEIKPAPRSNPKGEAHKPWNIWKNGKNTNVKPTKQLAEEAADRLRFSGVTTKTASDKLKHYMDCSRPSGAPKIGDKIQFYINDDEQEGVVTDYLASQFIVEYGKNKHRIVGVKEDWNVVK